MRRLKFHWASGVKSSAQRGLQSNHASLEIPLGIRRDRHERRRRAWLSNQVRSVVCGAAMRCLKFHFAATKVRPKFNASRSATGPRYNVCSGPVRPRGPVQRVVQAFSRSSLGRTRPSEIEPEGFEIQSSSFLGGRLRPKPHFEIEPEGFEIQWSSFLGGSPQRKRNFRVFGSGLLKF